MHGCMAVHPRTLSAANCVVTAVAPQLDAPVCGTEPRIASCSLSNRLTNGGSVVVVGMKVDVTGTWDLIGLDWTGLD